MCKQQNISGHVFTSACLSQADRLADLRERFIAVHDVLSSRGTVRQHRSRPLRAKLVLSCPKVAVLLLLPKDTLCIPLAHPRRTSPSPAASRTTSFEERNCDVLEVSVHHIQWQAQAGSERAARVQSGTGPLSFEVRCRNTVVSSVANTANRLVDEA